MPEKKTVERAKKDLRQGKSPTTPLENSYMKRLNMFVKANMERAPRNKQLRSA